MYKERLCKRWQKLKTHRPSFKLIGGTQGRQFSCVFSLGEFVITRLSKKVFSLFFRMHFTYEWHIPRILQLQCLLFSEIVSTTVKDGSLTRILFTIKWMRLSRIWRIKQIQEGVIYKGRRPRWITPSEICLLLHILRKPNSLIALLFIQNNS